MNTIHIDPTLLFILVRDASLDGHKHVVEYLKEQYNATITETEQENSITFKDDNYYTLFILTYSNYIKAPL